METHKMTLAEYTKIHRDFRGVYDGKRSVFMGCIIKGGGSTLAIEGIHFEIIPPKKISGRSKI